jgi:hypothetical protein
MNDLPEKLRILRNKGIKNNST